MSVIIRDWRLEDDMCVIVCVNVSFTYEKKQGPWKIKIKTDAFVTYNKTGIKKNFKPGTNKLIVKRRHQVSWKSLD